MKISIFSTLISALAGVLVMADPTPQLKTSCQDACNAKCDAAGLRRARHIGCKNGTPVVCDCL
ncbi:hypothetical protein LZ30DRAFT_701463 [Colletotrichum cereale]|nr:hypothetical protein LZ30DRAFT_701463 [Colletotrichum cereale]